MSLKPLGAGFEPLIEQVRASVAPSLVIDDAKRRALVVLLDRIAEWNPRVDLTAARGPGEHVDLVMADALVVAANEPSPAGTRVVDVGSGAGAPGLCLALLRPELALTLVEPRSKRVAFLRTTLAVLGRLDVEVVRATSDSLPDGAFEVALSRATLPPAEWLPEGERLASRAVWVLLAQGVEPEPSRVSERRSFDYAWPLTGARRRALRFATPHESSASAAS